MRADFAKTNKQKTLQRKWMMCPFWVEVDEKVSRAPKEDEDFWKKREDKENNTETIVKEKAFGVEECEASWNCGMWTKRTAEILNKAMQFF